MASTRTEDLLSIVRVGLRPQAVKPKKIIVVGAGMAGLVAGYELKQAGHKVKILEGQERVGGRILTIREPFSDGLYGEAGAMRLPTAHRLTQTYIEKFSLPITEFKPASTNAFFYFQGRKYLRSDVNHDPACLGFNLAGPDGNETVLQLWAKFIHDTAEHMKTDQGYWDELSSRYADYSFYSFLRSEGWSPDAITAFTLLEGLEPDLNASFLESLQVDLQWHDTDMVQIVGGMDQLPMAFLPQLKNEIQFGAAMIALDYTADSVTVHYQSEAGLEHVTGDFAILTLPFSAMRFVDVVQPFSSGKQMAIRQIHYDNAVKVLLQCRRRFWEEDDGLYGGVTITDLPNRLIYYPDHGRETRQGVLMGCYVYCEEAIRWASLSPEDRIAQTLKYVAKIHPQITREFVVGFSKDWGSDKFAGGMGANFMPGQQARLYSHIAAPEGPIHFAGEHTTLKHTWIEGAVESGLRAAQEVHERSLIAASL